MCIRDSYYPVPQPANAELYGRYKALGEALPNVHFAGRLGTYKYYNMDQVVAQALALYAKLAEQAAVRSNQQEKRLLAVPVEVSSDENVRVSVKVDGHRVA